MDYVLKPAVVDCEFKDPYSQNHMSLLLDGGLIILVVLFIILFFNTNFSSFSFFFSASFASLFLKSFQFLKIVWLPEY